METWATVALVLGSNAIVVIGGLIGVKKQIKHWSERFRMEWKARIDQDRRERRREVGSERLSKLSIELARMAAKGERVGELVKQMTLLTAAELACREEGGWLKEGQVVGGLNEAMNDWNSYIDSGVFREVLFMQDDVKLVDRVSDIWQEYDRARFFMDIGYIKRLYGWMSDEKKKQEAEEMREQLRKNSARIVGNREKVAEVQAEIRRQLDEL